MEPEILQAGAEAAGERLLDLVLEIAGGMLTKTELRGAREISIWKDGVVL